MNCTCGKDLATHEPRACLYALAAQITDPPIVWTGIPWRDAGRILEAAAAKDPRWPAPDGLDPNLWREDGAWRCTFYALSGLIDEDVTAHAVTAELAITRTAAMWVVASKEGAK